LTISGSPPLAGMAEAERGLMVIDLDATPVDLIAASLVR
jgi:hypothetical protein